MKFVLLILCFFVSTALSQAKMAVAVNDLRGHGITAEESFIITERFRSELLATQAFSVMERTEMESILKEQGFQQSGICSDGSCLVEVGRLLAVDQILSGSVGRLDDIFTINIKLIDVQSGEIIGSAVIDYKGKISDLLSGGIRQAAEKISNEARALCEKKGKYVGTLSIISQPDSAELRINGVPKGKTPLAGLTISAGTVRLSLSQKNYWTLDTTITLGVQDSRTISLNLKKIDKRATKTLGYSTGGLFIAGGLATGIIFGNILGQQQEKYNNLKSGDASRFEESRKEINTSATWRTVGYVAAAIGVGLCTVTFMF